MSWVDWLIGIVLALAALGGLRRGFFRAFFALAGLLGGVNLAAWNYARLAASLRIVVSSETLASAIAFCLIVAFTMLVANMAGLLLARTARMMGLGCVDRLAGGFFGFFQGMLLLSAVMLVAVAFFPGARWLTHSRLTRHLFDLNHMSIPVAPEELAYRARQGVRLLEERSPDWVHPGLKE